MAKMLVTYRDGASQRVGVSSRGRIAPLDEGQASMLDVIDNWSRYSETVKSLGDKLARGEKIGAEAGKVTLDAPIPRPRRNPFLLAGNYKSHVAAAEKITGVPLSERKQAIFFTKPNNSVVGPTANVEFNRAVTQKVDYELELVVVIGRRGKDIPAERAMDFVFGYTIGNDVSARDIQVVKPTVDFLRGKGLDTFFPLGPGIVLRDDIPDYRPLRMRLWVNGELKQEGTPGQMTRDVPTIIAELSRSLTLEPGDIIATGTPSGVLTEQPDPKWLKDGDLVVGEIEELGRLENHIREVS